MKRWNLRDFARDQDGGVLIYTAFSGAVMLGMLGLAVDVGYWYQSKRDMQSAADAAAMAAVLELARGATPAEIKTRARETAALNGYSGTDVSIYNPPLSGIYAGNPNFIEAVVSQDQPGFVSGIIYSGDMLVMARAVGTLAGGPACVIALNPTDDAVLTAEGNAAVDLNCGAHANSTSDTGLSETGGKSYINSTGNIQTAASSYEGSDFDPDPITDMPPMEDPFTYLVPPTAGPCLEPAGASKLYPSSFTGTIPAGNYCGGIEIQGADVDFEAGVYTMGEVGLHITGNVTVTGDDVTFYFPDTVFGLPSKLYPDPLAPLNIALYIAGTSTTVLSAPTSGFYQGVLFYQDPASDPTLIWELTGGGDMSLGGTLYAPSADIYFSGNQAAAASDIWTAVIGDEVHFVGATGLAGAGFTGGNLPLAFASPSLVE